MWGTVLALALIAACEPVRLGMAVFLVSGPRPLVNLRAFWIGAITNGTVVVLCTVILFRDFWLTIVHGATSMAASSSFRHIQLAAGLVALLVAALLLGFSARQRARASLPSTDPPAPALAESTSKIFSRLSSHSQDVLERGLPWLAFAVGLWLSMAPVEWMGALGVILASGAAPATQISAAAVFAVVSLVIFEIPLVSYLVTPAKTQAMTLQLHDWVRARRRWILAIIIGAAGFFLVAAGIGGV